jgi:hypothetical protein
MSKSNASTPAFPAGGHEQAQTARARVPVTGALVLLALLAVIAAAFWVAGHLALLAVIAAVANVAFRLGRHDGRRAQPGQARPPRGRPEKPAATGAVPAATLPLGGDWDEPATRQPASQPAGRA